MLYEINQFNFDVANIKKDLEIENIVVTDEQVTTLKQYINQEISFQEELLIPFSIEGTGQMMPFAIRRVSGWTRETVAYFFLK